MAVLNRKRYIALMDSTQPNEMNTHCPWYITRELESFRQSDPARGEERISLLDHRRKMPDAVVPLRREDLFYGAADIKGLVIPVTLSATIFSSPRPAGGRHRGVKFMRV